MSTPLIEALRQADKRSPLQEKAWEAFFKLGLPGPKHEAFKYFKLKGLYQKNWSQKTLEIDGSWVQKEVKKLSSKNVLVTYNGHFLKEYSFYPDFEKSLIVLPFKEALQSYASFFHRHYERQLAQEKDPFALLALATWQEGLFVYVPKNCHFDEELTLLELNSGDEPSSVSSVMLISLGQHAHLKLITQVKSFENVEMLALPYKGFHLDQGAVLKHTHVCTKAEAFRLESMRIEQMRDSRYLMMLGALANPKMRQSLHVNLHQEGAHADLSGLLALKEKEQGHVHVAVSHQAPHCYSSQLFKHLLHDEAIASFEGKIFVEACAQKTNAYQLNQNCLLSPLAQAYSKPNLEIFADDVKASHGSTTGQVDKEQLFYLLSRGLSKAQAEHILLKGFCDEVLEKSPSLEAHSFIQKMLRQYLEEAL